MWRDWTHEEDRNAETGAAGRDLPEDQRRLGHTSPAPANQDRSTTPDHQERSPAENSERTYYLGDRWYVLRESEFSTLTEIGRFRVIDLADLAEFAYRSDETRMAR